MSDEEGLVERLKAAYEVQRSTAKLRGELFNHVEIDPDDLRRILALTKTLAEIEARLDRTQTYLDEADARVDRQRIELADERKRGQDEGFAAAVAQLRDMSAQKPPPALWHAAAMLDASLSEPPSDWAKENTS